MIVGGFRCPEVIVSPPLWYEDGTYIFGYYYSNNSLGSIFRLYGYLSLLPNLIGYCLLRLPTEIAYRGFGLVPLILFSLTCASIASTKSRAIIPNDRIRWVAALGVVLLPFSSLMLVTSVMYSLWNCLLLLVLMTFWPFPRSIVGRLSFSLIYAVLLCSHPLSLVVAPILLLRGLLPIAGSRWPWPAIMIFSFILSLYLTFGFEYRPDHLFIKPLNVLSLLLQYASLQVVFPTILGEPLLRWLHSEGLDWIAHAASTILVMSLVAQAIRVYHKDRRATLGLLILVYLIGTLTILYFFSRSGAESKLFSAAPRYFYVQRVLLFLGIIGLLEKDLNKAQKSLGLRSLFALSMMSWIATLNYFDFGRFSSELIVRRATEARKFVNEVLVEEKSLTDPKDIHIVKVRGEHWDIELAPSREFLDVGDTFFSKWRENPSVCPDGWRCVDV